MLDINLGAEKDGVWLAQQLRAAQMDISIIYLTAYSDKQTLEKVKATQPKAYLKKPYDETTFCTTLELISAQISKEGNLNSQLENQFLVVKDGRKRAKIDLVKLQYVQSDGNYVRLGLTDATYFIRANLKWYLENLPATHFFQIHRRTIVNKKHVTSKSNKEIYIGDQSFSISNSYRSELNKLL